MIKKIKIKKNLFLEQLILYSGLEGLCALRLKELTASSRFQD